MSLKRCIQIWFLLQVSFNALHVSDTEIVYPKRHHRERPQNDLGTLNQNGFHEDYVTYEIKAKKDHHFLDLKKIEQTHQKFIWLRSIENGKEVAVKHYPENCYYEGKVRGIKDSYAFISTCSGGLTGTIDDGKTRYDIIPQDNGIKHKYHNVENLMRKKYKEMKKSVIYGNNEVGHEKLRNRRTVPLSDASPYLVDVESRYQSYTKNKTLYTEVFVSCDYRMLQGNAATLYILKPAPTITSLSKSHNKQNNKVVLCRLTSDLPIHISK
ncbi:zinc metalloproteinase-disintegrin-like HF3 [Hydra vulgaris]|uniref:Zinc metalloproteinase-disintegrin-like HF3 n=1 Tax=Hydra vulgaris TaxID=6087 RepID=A0ABM4B9E9_HYDVU